MALRALHLVKVNPRLLLCCSGGMRVPQCGQFTFSEARILSKSSLPRRGIQKHYRRRKSASLCKRLF